MAAFPATSPHLHLRPWLVTVGVALAFLAGHFIAIPQVEEAWSLAREPEWIPLLGLFNYRLPHFSIFDSCLTWLVLVRGAVALISPEPRANRWLALGGFAVYLALCFGSGVWATRDLGLGFTIVGGEIVDDPRLPHLRLVGALWMTGGGALAWGLARAVTRWGVGHGSLFLFLVESLAFWLAFSASLDSALIVSEPVFGAVIAAKLAAAAGVALALWRWQPSWPAKVTRGAWLLSPVDLLPMPSIVATLVVALPSLAIPFVPFEGARTVMDALAVLRGLTFAGIAVCIGWWLQRNARGPGGPAWRVVALVVPVGTALLCGLGAVTRGALDSGPLAAEGAVDVVIQADDGAAADARLLVQRLESVGADPEVRSASPKRIVLRLEHVTDGQDTVAAILPRGVIELRPVAHDQQGLRPQEGEVLEGLRRETEPDGPVWVGPRIEAERLLTRVAEPGRALIDCWPSNEGLEDCTARILEQDLILSSRDVAHVTLSESASSIRIELRPAAAHRLDAATSGDEGRRVAIVADDEIVASPVIHGPVGANVEMELRGSDDSRADERRANWLVASLRSGPLRGHWRIVEERPVR